jgi:hypothetical protein
VSILVSTVFDAGCGGPTPEVGSYLPFGKGKCVFVYSYCFCEFKMVKRKNLIDSDSGESDESGSDLDSVSLY